MKHPREYSQKKKITIVIAWVLLVVFVVAGILLVRWMNEPVEQTVTVSSSPVSQAVKPTTSDQEVTTAFFTTKAPSTFTVRKTDNPSNPLLLQMNVFEAKAGGRQVGITSNVLPSEGIPGVANYNYRVKKPETYKKITFADAPSGSTTFEATSGERELTTFFANGKRYASVTITGNTATQQQLHELMKQILTNWTWK